MRPSPITVKAVCALSFMLALLVIISFGSCTTKQWQLLHTDNVLDGVPVVALMFTDIKHGWALTVFQLLETNDGGKTWTARLESDDGKMAFYSFDFINPTTGFIVGAQRKDEGRATLILRTNDSGRSWQESSFHVSSPNAKAPLQLNSVSFCNPQVGWAVGSNLILHTTDGGQTWETQRNGNSEEMLFGVACGSPERAWVVGVDGLILQTKDGGRSWERQSSGTTDALVRVRSFADGDWVVGGRAGKGILLRASNDGTKWEQVPLNSTEGLTDIYMSGQQGWLVGVNGTILHTDDGGQTWKQERSPTNNSLISVFFLNPRQGWIGGDKRTILRLAE